MSKGKKNKVKEITREELLSNHVAALLAAKQITPSMIYDLVLDGCKVYKQGVGLPEKVVLQAIIDQFVKRGQTYMNPYTLATLKDKNFPESDDFEPLTAPYNV